MSKNRMISQLAEIIFSLPEEEKKKIIKCMISFFTTKKLCNSYEFCGGGDDSYAKHRISTNPSFPNFFQTIYHAGTVEQFKQFASPFPNLNTLNLPLKTHGSNFHFPVVINEQNIMKTFNYLFFVFKKGVYVEIKNNALKVFLPFSNTKYQNDWGYNLRTKNGNWEHVVNLQNSIHKNYNDPPEYHTMIQRNPSRWYANYCIFRNTVYKNGKLRLLDDEGDKSIVNFLELLTELCYKREISDVAFFINPRDFPVLKKDLTHPYDVLYTMNKKPVPDLSIEYPLDKGYLPIFSQSTTNDYADTLMPNDDDITGLLCDEQTLYQTTWSKKKDMAVFRGSATGCGIIAESNQRLHLTVIAKNYPGLMDVALTGLNRKLKYDPKLDYIDLIDPKIFKTGTKMDTQDQSKFKYIIHVQGHVAAFRLARELSYKSVILKVDSPWKTWYSDQLVGFDISAGVSAGVGSDRSAHYISIKSDLSNLVETIEWCKNNDHICKRIAERGYNFWKTNLSASEYLLDYMQTRLNQIVN